MDHVVLVLTCLILACSNCISAQFTVLPEESPVVVAVRDVAVITCRTSIIRELVEVRWFRSYAGHRNVISIFQDGRDQQRCDLPQYIGRMELVKEDLARGSVALKLFNVSVADEGAYHCFLETADYFDIGDLELRVTAPGSHPRIDIGGFQDGGLKVVCRSAGWYPEPTLVNKDDDGEVKIQQEVNGLYSIEYSRIITENSNRTFSCLIQTLFPHQERESSLYVTDGLFRKSTDVFIILFVVALVLFLATMAILCVSCACRTNKQGSSKFSLPFCTRLATSKKRVIRDQQSDSHYLTDTSSAVPCLLEFGKVLASPGLPSSHPHEKRNSGTTLSPTVQTCELVKPRNQQSSCEIPDVTRSYRDASLESRHSRHLSDGHYTRPLQRCFLLPSIKSISCRESGPRACGTI